MENYINKFEYHRRVFHGLRGRFVNTNVASLVALLIMTSGCAGFPKNEPTLEDQEVNAAEVSLEKIIDEGDKALKEGDLDAAQVNYAIAVEREPDNVQALYKLGFVHNEKGTLDVAETVLRHALLADPEHQASLQTLAEIMLKTERNDESEKLLERLILLNPTAWEAHNTLGVLFDLSTRHLEAREKFTNALEIKPRTARVLNNFGYSYYLTGDFNSAESYYRQALDSDPEYHRVWSNLALLYSREGRLRDASAAFREVVGEHQAANNLGYLSMLQGKDDIAYEQFTHAIELSAAYYDLANRNMAILNDATRAPSIMSETLRDKNADELAFSKAEHSADILTGTKDRPAVDSATALKPDSPTNIIRLGNIGIPDHKPEFFDDAELRSYLEYIGFYTKSGAEKNSDSLKNAISAFQKYAELTTDGVNGPITQASLMGAIVRKLHGDLLLLGYKINTADSELTRTTRNAIIMFELDRGIPVTGNLTPALIDHLNTAKSQVLRDINSSDSIDISARG